MSKELKTEILNSLPCLISCLGTPWGGLWINCVKVKTCKDFVKRKRKKMIETAEVLYYIAQDGT